MVSSSGSRSGRRDYIERNIFIKSELDIMENSRFIIVVLAWGSWNCPAHARGNQHFCDYANFHTIGPQTRKGGFGDYGLKSHKSVHHHHLYQNLVSIKNWQDQSKVRVQKSPRTWGVSKILWATTPPQPHELTFSQRPAKTNIRFMSERKNNVADPPRSRSRGVSPMPWLAKYRHTQLSSLELNE